MDNLQFDAEITDVKWVTNTKGIVNPILVLDKEYEATKDKDSQKFDGIMFKDIEDIKAKLCGIGSKVQVVCDEKLVPTIGTVYETSDTFKFPKNCMFCKNELQTLRGITVCTNHLCIAQGRTAIFKLIMACNMVSLDRKGIVDIHKYLNDFPYLGDTSHIEHIYSYLKLLKTVEMQVDTEKRKEALVELFGGAGAGVWLYEFTVLINLKKGLGSNEFWYVMGLPFDEKDAAKMAKFDIMKNGLDKKKIKSLKLSTHGQQVVFDNTQLINLVYKELKTFLK